MSKLLNREQAIDYVATRLCNALIRGADKPATGWPRAHCGVWKAFSPDQDGETTETGETVLQVLSARSSARGHVRCVVHNFGLGWDVNRRECVQQFVDLHDERGTGVMWGLCVQLPPEARFDAVRAKFGRVGPHSTYFTDDIPEAVIRDVELALISKARRWLSRTALIGDGA